jgi:hypothetical protein
MHQITKTTACVPRPRLAFKLCTSIRNKHNCSDDDDEAPEDRNVVHLTNDDTSTIVKLIAEDLMTNSKKHSCFELHHQNDENKKLCLQAGGHSLIVGVMKKYLRNPQIQKEGCCTIKKLVLTFMNKANTECLMVKDKEMAATVAAMKTFPHAEIIQRGHSVW